MFSQKSFIILALSFRPLTCFEWYDLKTSSFCIFCEYLFVPDFCSLIQQICMMYTLCARCCVGCQGQKCQQNSGIRMNQNVGIKKSNSRNLGSKVDSQRIQRISTLEQRFLQYNTRKPALKLSGLLVKKANRLTIYIIYI